MTKILFTGSHAGTTAIAVINEIKKQNLNWEMFFIGKKWASEDKKSFTLEYQELPKLNVKFYSVESGKIQTKFTKNTIKALFKIPLGFFQVPIILLITRPNVVLSFGGSAGFVTSFWSWIFRIPVIIHEQTAAAGRSNIYSSRFSRVVALARESSKVYFKNVNTKFTGNPISMEITKYLDLKANKHVNKIFVTGGSRGSKWINDAFIPIVSGLLKKYKIVWQCGIEELKRVNIKNPNLKLFGRISPDEFIKILSESDLVIGRAGGNTVAELIALRKPSILIPIPWSYLNEQNENAKFIQKLGLARIINQDELSPSRLRQEIDDISENYSNIIEKTRGVKSSDLNASRCLVDLIKYFL